MTEQQNDGAPLTKREGRAASPPIGSARAMEGSAHRARVTRLETPRAVLARINPIKVISTTPMMSLLFVSPRGQSAADKEKVKGGPDFAL